MLNRRQRELLQTLWKYGPLSRWELHERTTLTPNGVGSLVDSMLRSRLIRERPPEPAKMGRPRVPLEIEPERRHLLGLALVPGRAEITRFGLTGKLIGEPMFRRVSTPAALVETAVELLLEYRDSNTLAIGLTSTGFLDPVHKRILFSSAFPRHDVESLVPIFEAAAETPIVLGNDQHAVAARWLLTHRADQQQDLLIVWFSDGRFGSALLVDGVPNRGCMTGGNELGHTRFPGIDTELCFCGQMGCLERIVSSDFLKRQSPHASNDHELTLGDSIARFDPAKGDPALEKIIELLALSLSNAVNFLRVHRLVLISPYTYEKNFTDALSRQVHALMLPKLSERVKIDLWHEPSSSSAQNAGWLALAELLYGGWDASGGQTKTNSAAAVYVA